MRIASGSTFLALLLLCCCCSLPSLSAAQQLRQQGERQDDDGTAAIAAEDPYYKRVPSTFDAYGWERNAPPRASDQVEQEKVERVADTSAISESLMPYLDRFKIGGNENGNSGVVGDEWNANYEYNEIEAKGKGKGKGKGKHKRDKGHSGKGKGKGRRRHRHKRHYKRRFKHTYIPYTSTTSPQPSPPNGTAVPTRVAPSSSQPQPSTTAQEPTAFPSSAEVDNVSTDTPSVQSPPSTFPSLTVPPSGLDATRSPAVTGPVLGRPTAVTSPSPVTGGVPPLIPPQGTPGGSNVTVLPNVPVVPAEPCSSDAACSFINGALDPVFPSQTRARINIPGTCQNWAREWLRTGQDVTEFPVERIRQRFTMALLYCEWNGDNWPDGELWLSEMHECDWYSNIGVDPCSRDDTYQIIRSNGQQMQGTLPPEMAMLTSLWEISLADNMLSGAIPYEFRELSQLDTVSLSSNLFEGPIPSFMWEFEDMTYLDLANNMFTGTIPNTVHLTEPNLNVLLVGNNDLSGSIPSTLGSLNWNRLHLDGNEFSGSIPPNLNSINLEELYLHNNQLTGTFPASPFVNDYGSQSKLREVTLYNNNLSGNVDEMCTLVSTAKLEVFAVDLDKIQCSCCSPAP